MFSKEKDDDERFKIVYKQGTFNSFRILLDRETGVNYIYYLEGYSGGLTALLDKDGKPVITEIE